MINHENAEITYKAFHAERICAHAKHDVNGASMERKNWADSAWLPVIVEEVGEVARVLCEQRQGNYDTEKTMAELEKELIQVGAMVAAWIDALNTGEKR